MLCGVSASLEIQKVTIWRYHKSRHDGCLDNLCFTLGLMAAADYLPIDHLIGGPYLFDTACMNCVVASTSPAL